MPTFTNLDTVAVKSLLHTVSRVIFWLLPFCYIFHQVGSYVISVPIAAISSATTLPLLCPFGYYTVTDILIGLRSYSWKYVHLDPRYRAWLAGNRSFLFFLHTTVELCFKITQNSSFPSNIVLLREGWHLSTLWAYGQLMENCKETWTDSSFILWQCGTSLLWSLTWIAWIAQRGRGGGIGRMVSPWSRRVYVVPERRAW